MSQELTNITAAVAHGLPNRMLLTFHEASQVLNISQGMLRKLGRLGRIKVTHIGRCARISKDEVLRLCNGQVLEGGK